MIFSRIQNHFLLYLSREISVFSIFDFFATTFTVNTSLQGPRVSQIRSEMEFPDRVDIFQKKSHQKILSFRKVTSLYFGAFFRCFFFYHKCLFELEMSSQPRGRIHIEARRVGENTREVYQTSILHNV